VSGIDAAAGAKKNFPVSPIGTVQTISPMRRHATTLFERPAEYDGFDHARVWRQPWRECGVTGRITPTEVMGGFVKPRLPNPL